MTCGWVSRSEVSLQPQESAQMLLQMLVTCCLLQLHTTGIPLPPCSIGLQRVRVRGFPDARVEAWRRITIKPTPVSIPLLRLSSVSYVLEGAPVQSRRCISRPFGRHATPSQNSHASLCREQAVGSYLRLPAANWYAACVLVVGSSIPNRCSRCWRCGGCV